MKGSKATPARKASGKWAQKLDEEKDKVKDYSATQYRIQFRNRAFPFMKLPGELRNMVYELALPRQDLRRGMYGVHRSGILEFCSLALVSRIVSREVCTLMYGTRLFPISFMPGGPAAFCGRGDIRNSKDSMPSRWQVVPKIRRFSIQVRLLQSTCKALLCKCVRGMSLFLKLLSDPTYHGIREVHMELSWQHQGVRRKIVNLNGAREVQKIYDAFQSIRADKKIHGNWSFDVEPKLKEHFFKGELPENINLTTMIHEQLPPSEHI